MTCWLMWWFTGHLVASSPPWGSTRKTLAKVWTNPTWSEWQPCSLKSHGYLYSFYIVYSEIHLTSLAQWLKMYFVPFNVWFSFQKKYKFFSFMQYPSLFAEYRSTCPPPLPAFLMSWYTHPNYGPNRNITTWWLLLPWLVGAILLQWRSPIWWQMRSRSS